MITGSIKEENAYLKAEVRRLREELVERDHLIAVMQSQLHNLKLLRNESISVSDDGDSQGMSRTSSTLKKRASHDDAISPVPLAPPRRSLDQVENSTNKIRLPELNGTGDDETKKMQTSKGAIKALPRELSIINSDSDDVTKYSAVSGQFRLEQAEMRDAYNARGLYTGEISRKEQMPHGKGRMDYHSQGRFYEGDWNMGHWHGYGIIRNAFGDNYRGQIKNDLREGRGRLEYSDGRVFEGKFKADDPVQGTLTFTDGAKYVGEMNDGKRHGIGIYYFADGSRYEGESVNNLFEGKGKMVWEDGGYYEGEWAQGEIDGFGKEIRSDGSVRHEGMWRNGFPVRK